jgi:Domain of unknown function (DUF4884)
MRYIPLLLLLLPIACTVQHPITQQPAENNKDYTVEYLFEHEGCKVYRFKEHTSIGTYYVYFTNCNGEAISRTDSTAVRNSTHVTRPSN